MQGTTTYLGLEPDMYWTKVHGRLAAARRVMPAVTEAFDGLCTGQTLPLFGNDAQLGSI